MRYAFYKLINKLGYKIENRNNIKLNKINSLKKFHVISNHDLLYNAQEFVFKLEKEFSDFRIESHEEGFLVYFFNLKIYVESVEEFYILSEVFIEKDYNFITSEKVVIVDIGTNIGIASLFFSAMENVEKIYSFEPVLQTYNQAKLNFENNSISKKIAVFSNFGLGKNNREETFIFDKKVKGNTGVRGKLSNSYANNADVELAQVIIKNASEEFNTIINQNPNNKIVVKMDCEGAEYEIFESLSNEILQSVSIFMIEWHDKGSDVIVQKLLENNFNIFLRELAPNAGIIYASKY